jgi:hypothetical protein
MSLSPDDPEHSRWYFAVIGAFFSAVVMLIAKLWNRQEKKLDAADITRQLVDDAQAKHLSEIENRLVAIEIREVATKEDIRRIVADMTEEILRRFDHQVSENSIAHAVIVKQIESSATVTNGRIDTILITLMPKPGGKP